MLGETLAEARDNARFATADEHVQLAVPDGVEAVPVDLWDEGLASVPTARKVELALALEAQARAADPRIRQVDAADYGDVASESALVSTTGIRSSSRKTSGYLSVGVIAGEGEASQTGGGYSVGRGFEELDPTRACDDAVTRAVRLLGATKGPSGRSTVVFDRRMATTLLSIVSSALSGEAVAKGRSFFAGRIGEQVGHPGLTLVDDPTDPRAYGAAAYDAEGLACRRNVLIDSGVLRGFLYDTVSGSRAGVPSTGSAVRGGYAGTPGPGCRALTLAPGPGGLRRGRGAGGGGGGPLRPVHDRRPLRGEPDQRRLLGRCRGPDDPRRQAGRAGPGDHRGVHAPAHAAVPRGGRCRRRVAAQHRRRPDPGHRRHAGQRGLTPWRPVAGRLHSATGRRPGVPVPDYLVADWAAVALVQADRAFGVEV